MVGVTVEPEATNSRSQLFFVLVWLLITAMLVVGSQAINAPQALGDEGLLDQASQASDFPLSGVDPADAANPSIVYSGMLWSVTDARVINAEGFLARASVEIDVTLTNTLSSTQLRVPDSMVRLLSDDARSATPRAISSARFVDAGARLAIEPGETVEVTVRYEVGYTQRPDLEGLALQVAEPNRIPAVIALGSGEATFDYPVFGALDTSAISLPDPDSATRRIVLEPAAAAIDINAGPYRAAIGEELALVKVSVQRAESNPEAGYLQTGYWALDADGEQVSAILVARTSEPASNTDEVTLLFAFPAGSDELTVTAAAGSDDAVGFAIVLPTGS